MLTRCSCGCREAHVVAERRTADDVAVCLWSDGEVTGRLGIYPRGLGKLRTSSDRYLCAGWLALNEVCMYEWSEVAQLVRTTRKAYAQTSLMPVEYVRRSMAGEHFRSDGRLLVSK
jgi:hypothetical protein